MYNSKEKFMTVLIQNQGKRKFVLPEGTIAPLRTLEVSEEGAKICESYPDELKILKVLSAKQAEPVVVEQESDDLMLKTKVELMEMLDEKGIEYKPIMNKAQLIELLQGE
jgi:hypothetical protein